MEKREYLHEYYLQEKEVFMAFVEQLKKDGEMVGVELRNDLFKDANLSVIIGNIADVVSALAGDVNGMEKLRRWLYRVDVEEEMVRERMYENGQNYVSVVAELIIKRTLQKVVMRYLYRKGEL